MRIIMKLLLFTTLAALASAAFEDRHLALRHRRLQCAKRKEPCTSKEDCCGKLGCDETCCVSDGQKGCEFDADCCGELTCAASLCGDSTLFDGGRDCFIHGEVCTVTADNNDCCGSTKYRCEVTETSGPAKCCIPVGNKGCSFDYHCCPDANGEFTTCKDSTCMDSSGTLPPDAPGGRDCQLKGDPCDSVEDCCGSKRLDCKNVWDPAKTTCCIKDNTSGCESNDQCCSSCCNVSTSTCVDGTLCARI